MLTIEDVKEEYYRIEKLLGREALTTTEYAAYVKNGFSAHYIKRDLGLSYNDMKKVIGAELATTMNMGPKLSTKKIYCARGEGKMISIDECVVGCNPAVCDRCPSKQLKNIKASDDTLTADQEESMRHHRSFGSSGALAANEGIYAD